MVNYSIKFLSVHYGPNSVLTPKRLAQLENERVEREQAERARQLAEQERLTKAQQQKDEPKRERDNSPRPF